MGTRQDQRGRLVFEKLQETFKNDGLSSVGVKSLEDIQKGSFLYELCANHIPISRSVEEKLNTTEHFSPYQHPRKKDIGGIMRGPLGTIHILSKALVTPSPQPSPQTTKEHV